MPRWAKSVLDRWTTAAGIRNGHLFRAIAQKGNVGNGLFYRVFGPYKKRPCDRGCAFDPRGMAHQNAVWGHKPLLAVLLAAATCISSFPTTAGVPILPITS
jgi:hypothetical protein